eukprot:267922-Chlamydomonas_euryale.AAC.1
MERRYGTEDVCGGCRRADDNRGEPRAAKAFSGTRAAAEALECGDLPGWHTRPAGPEPAGACNPQNPGLVSIRQRFFELALGERLLMRDGRRCGIESFADARAGGARACGAT